MTEQSNKQPDISVIVPIFNVEKFLSRCVDSIINQTHENIEIILVDDESPDRCGEIADEYAQKDSRIKVIHQKNKWLGGARNSGIKIAVGKYLLFVDSDDYIRRDMCEILYNKMEQNQTDMIVFGFCHVDNKGNELFKSIPQESNIVYTGERAREILYQKVIATHSLNSACMKIYRRNLFSDNCLLFDEKIRYAEDYEFCLRLFPLVSSFTCIDDDLYYYVENENSIMHVRDKEIMNKFIILYHYRERFLIEQQVDTAENKRLSAELLIKMVVNNFPRFLGKPARETKQESLSLIKEMLTKKEIIGALQRIDINNMDLGMYGKLIIRFMKKRQALLMYQLYAYQEKKGM